MKWKIIFLLYHNTLYVRTLILTFLLLLIFSNCLCVHSPMLCEPHSSNPTLVYVYVMHPIGIKYVRNIKTTLYLLKRRENRKNGRNVMMACSKSCKYEKKFQWLIVVFLSRCLEGVVCDYCHHKCNFTGVESRFYI